MIEQARRPIAGHFDDDFTLDERAERAGVSAGHLHRSVTERVGLTPKQFRDALRMERFKAEVRDGSTVSRTTFEAGFGSSRASGEPGAARAVAAACAANRVALLIPCHRVVRGDGTRSGCRWGSERKDRILRLESRRTSGGQSPTDE